MIKKGLKGLKHPKLSQTIRAGIVLFLIATIIGGIIAAYDLGVASLIQMIL